MPIYDMTVHAENIGCEQCNTHVLVITLPIIIDLDLYDKARK